jgi:hypothetical protein
MKIKLDENIATSAAVRLAAQEECPTVSCCGGVAGFTALREVGERGRKVMTTQRYEGPERSRVATSSTRNPVDRDAAGLT